MKLISSLQLLASIAPALAIPPENFGFPSAPNDTALSVNFAYSGSGANVYTSSTGQSYLRVQEGELLGINVPAQPPVIALPLQAFPALAHRPQSSPYILMMVDPDAPYPQSPTRRFILHYMQLNATYTIVDNATASLYGGYPFFSTNTNLSVTYPPAVVPYKNPAPPTNSSAHRYILYAFSQPNNYSLPDAYTGYSSTNYTGFNLTGFIAESGLADPVAAMYYYCSNETAVPSTLTAAAGATYPGGNGQMVTSGYVAVPTGNMTTGMSTASASFTGASSTAAGAGSTTGSASGGGASATSSRAAAAGAMKADSLVGMGAVAAAVAAAAGIGAAGLVL